VSFGGGGTDMEPYCSEHGGAVISTTISKFTYVTMTSDLEPDRGTIIVNAYDLNQRIEFDVGDYQYNDQVDLVKAVLKHFDVQQPLEISIHSDLPPGSGLATSSSLVVALIGACARLQGRSMTRHDIAYLAYKLEREELGQRGGYQDQFAATFGGFNYMEFWNRVTVMPLRLSPRMLLELRYRLLLIYTGQTHLSAGIQEQVMAGYEQQQASFLDGMEELKRVTKAIRDLLLDDDMSSFDAFGTLLHEGWLAKKSLSDRITTEEVEVLYLLARQEGAIGGKLLGAGGGGHLLLFIDPARRVELTRKLEELGGIVVPFEFESDGLQVWDY
jgi:D-glycero-alpha-D-manno-heptose-7-phosphate kinase